MAGAAGSVARAAFYRRVRVGGRAYEVRPPTVREALTVLYILRHMEDAADGAFLASVLTRWLGPRVGPLVATQAPKERSRALRHLILDGVPRDEPEPSPDEQRVVPQDIDSAAQWEALFFDYCAEAGSDWWAAYNAAPFPYFVAAMPHLARVKAARRLEAAEAQSVPHMKRRERRRYLARLKAIIDRRGPDPEPAKRTEDEIQAERESLARAMSGL